jgi:hypothetical protein
MDKPVFLYTSKGYSNLMGLTSRIVDKHGSKYQTK